MTTTYPDLLTLDDVAERLRTTLVRVSRWVRRGELPVVVLPDDQVRVDPRALDEWIVSRRTMAPESQEAHDAQK